tara:strand:+ start:132 stop:785 length:654 start_codon:yes stop_codon:yes gene_type:complete
MSLQTIIDNATFIEIDKGKVAAQSVSRSGVVLTAERASNTPYRFKVGMHSGLQYSTNRGLLEDIDALDLTVETTIDIGDTNADLSYITAYQGGVSSGTMTLVSVAGSTITVNASGVSGSGTLFKKGDYLQPVGNTGAYRYPYQVTADVAYSTSSSVAVPVHRPVISQDGVTMTSGNILTGKDVSFKVKMTKRPGYRVVPHDRIQFQSAFDLVEIIKT